MKVLDSALIAALVFLSANALAGEAKLVPYPIDWTKTDQSVIDMSGYLDAPAGRDGFVRVKGRHLVKPDGTRFRIWGVNICAGYAFPAKDLAPAIAGDLARCGVNAVRFHHLDSTWSPLFPKDRDNTLELDAGALDRFDFFIAELKKRGIYSNLNLNVGRQYRPGDGVRDAKLLGYGKSATYFNPRLIELQRDFARKLLTHRNPYTGSEYRHEPAICTVELVNENSVLEGWAGWKDRLSGKDSPNESSTWRPIPVSYARELTDQYNAWLGKNVSEEELEKLRAESGGDRVERLKRDQLGAASEFRFRTEARFYIHLERRFFEGMRRFMKDELGLKSLLIGSADHADSYCGYAHVDNNALLDYIDGHGYWQHPHMGAEFRIENTPMVNDPLDSTVVQFARTPMVGRPYTISETNHPYPAEYACEGIPILTAYALFHDWDGIYWFTYGTGRTQDPEKVWRGSFDFSNDPVKMTHLAGCASMFHRQDLATAKRTVVRVYDKNRMIDGLRMDRKERPFFDPEFSRGTALVHATRWTTKGEASTYPDAPPLDAIVADTGQIHWSRADGAKGLVAIDSLRSQALIGFVGDAGRKTTNLIAEVGNEFCALYLTSLDGKPVAQSGRLLLTTTARSTHTGFKWKEDRKHVEDWGQPPVVIEPVSGSVTLTGLKGVTGLVVTPLAAEGRPLEEPKAAERSGDGWKVSLGGPACTWRVIEVRR